MMIHRLPSPDHNVDMKMFKNLNTEFYFVCRLMIENYYGCGCA